MNFKKIQPIIRNAEDSDKNQKFRILKQKNQILLLKNAMNIWKIQETTNSRIDQEKERKLTQRFVI